MQQLVSRLQGAKGGIEEYRKVQSEQLAEIQFRLLDGITEQKISESSLRDIASTFKIMKESERLIRGEPTELVGIVGYLRALDKEEKGEEIDVTPLPQHEEATIVSSTMPKI